MADIAEEAGVGRATLYRHFPPREALMHGLADIGTRELADGIAAANLDELPVDRAIVRLIGVFLRTGAKYAAVIGHLEERHEPVAKQRVIQPVHDIIARGVRDGVLRTDLPGVALFEMFSALVERALWLTVADTVTPEAAAEAEAAVRWRCGSRPRYRGVGPARRPRRGGAPGTGAAHRMAARPGLRPRPHPRLRRRPADAAR
jgi:TetR/AcrR family transcriptional regulator, mexCD-oprJ operon repressor